MYNMWEQYYVGEKAISVRTVCCLHLRERRAYHCWCSINPATLPTLDSLKSHLKDFNPFRCCNVCRDRPCVFYFIIARNSSIGIMLAENLVAKQNCSKIIPGVLSLLCWVLLNIIISCSANKRSILEAKLIVDVKLYCVVITSIAILNWLESTWRVWSHAASTKSVCRVS